MEDINSPLLERYQDSYRKHQELVQEEVFKNVGHRIEFDYWKSVMITVEQMLQLGKWRIGFSHSVRRLVLFDSTLTESQQSLLVENSLSAYLSNLVIEPTAFSLHPSSNEDADIGIFLSKTPELSVLNRS